MQPSGSDKDITMARTSGVDVPLERVFINDNRTNARRIADETWEKLKPVIVHQYQDKTLDEVIDYMKDHHDFTPTRRQYVHRLGKIWRITKYAPKGGSGQATLKRPSPKPPSPINGEKPNAETKPVRNTGVKSHDIHSAQIGDSSKLQPRTPSPSFQQPYLGPPSPLPSDNEQEPEQYEPHLATPEDKEKQRLLAEILLALGDPRYAFTIWVTLHDVEPREEYIINSLRSIQSATQVKKAHAMIDAHLNQLRESGKGLRTDEEDDWETFLFDILGARTYDWGIYIGMGFRQIETAILKRVKADNDGREDLDSLAKRPREPAFDVPMFQFLSFALERYNEPAMNDDEFIDVAEVLRQFEDQQPYKRDQGTAGTLSSISSLPDCLEWCISVLDTNSQPAVAIESTSDINNRSTQFYSLLLTLWHASCTSSASPAWAQKTETQFAISPTELLSTVAAMIITSSPPSTSPLLSAQSLRTLSTEDLLTGFKNRIFHSTIELMNRVEPEVVVTAPPPPPPPPPARISPTSNTSINHNLLNSLRKFVIATLEIQNNDLPDLQEDTADIVCHLIAEHEELPSGPGRNVVQQHEDRSSGTDNRRRRLKRGGGAANGKPRTIIIKHNVTGKGKQKLEVGISGGRSRSGSSVGSAAGSDEDGDKMDIDTDEGLVGNRVDGLPNFD
ncbi:hypothetical protein QBC43DRAFT_326620 [Cladorrhinum sp. PSN259]|nr:hypothetical protein QBC43DRAFT_326620 [Cladorrhinum sp. PSN259]